MPVWHTARLPEAAGAAPLAMLDSPQPSANGERFQCHGPLASPMLDDFILRQTHAAALAYDTLSSGPAPAAPRGAAGRARSARAGAGTREVPALPHRRVAAALHLLSPQAPRAARPDAPVELRQKIQRAVRFPVRQSLAAVLFLDALRAGGRADLAGAALGVRPDADGKRPRQGRAGAGGNDRPRADPGGRPHRRRPGAKPSPGKRSNSARP